MLLFVLLFSSASAMELGLNMTGSGAAQSQTSTTSFSAPETISEIIITGSEVSTSPASPTSSSSPVSSPTVTDGPIYTNECNSDEGRNCDRLPEMPFWSGITPGDLVFGFTPTAQQNPWSYFFSFTVSGQPSSALESASSCSVAWYTNYTTWLATAPLTFSGVVPQTTATTTLDAETVPEISFGSTTGTATIIQTEIYTYSGEVYTSTITNAAYEYSSFTSTFTQIATTETLIYTSYTAAFYPSYDWKPQAPCCSGCTIYAGSVEVMYFPAATAAPGDKASTQPSTVVDSAGFTFTSPSVYMALQTLAASDLCGQVGSEITSATTLSFAQDQISTVPAYSSDGSIYTFYPYWSPTAYTAASFGTAPCTDVTTVTAAGGLTATVTYNPCLPYISIPPQIQTADPLWATCTSQWHFLLYDPPYVISAGTGIGGFTSSSAATTTFSIDPTSSPQAETTSSSVASTLPTPSAPTVSSTATVTTKSSVQPASTGSTPQVEPLSSSAIIQPVSTDGSTPVKSTTSSSHANPGDGQSTSLAVNTGPSAASSVGGAEGNPSTPAIVTIGSSTITANSASGSVIGSTTLTPGGEVTVGGTTVSLASNGASIAIGSSTQAIITTPSPTYLIGSQTLSAGGAPITVSGTTYSLESGGSSVVVGGTTQPIGALLGSSTPEYIVASGSQTLKAGAPAITVSGTLVSLQGGGSSVVLGKSTTEALSAFLGSTTTSGLAGIIATIGGFGTSKIGSTTSSTGVSPSKGTVFTGNAVKGDVGSVWMWGTMLGAGIVVVGLL